MLIVLVLGLWIVSGFYGRRWRTEWSSGSVTEFSIGVGCAGCVHIPPNIQYFENNRVNPYEWNRYPRRFRLWIHWKVYPDQVVLSVPLWIPLLLVALPIAFLWHREIITVRSVRAGLCQKCKYDRRGLALSASCPECNAAVGDV